MFLALKEMRHEKLRYSLIILMVTLIAYLIFILTSLAIGLANQNTQAINSWHSQTVVLNGDANINLSQSLITKKQLADQTINKKTAVIGQVPTVVKSKGLKRESTQFVGLQRSQYIYQNLKLVSGRKPTKAHEVVADTRLKQDGYRLGSTLKLNSTTTKYRIVGFTANAKLSVAPVLYGSLADWRSLCGLTTDMAGSAIIAKQANYKAKNDDLKAYTTQKFISKLPGYSAQNTTFTFMIGFLMVISLIVIAVFLYILTMQKLTNFAVLRAQGIPASVLVRATFAQSLLIVIGGLILGGLLTVATASALPFGVPITFDLPILASVSLGLLVISVLGVLIPVRNITKIDPVTVIGG